VGLHQETITPLILKHLVGVKSLNTKGCDRELRFAAAAFMGQGYELEEEYGHYGELYQVDDDDDSLTS
jgi:hypothetical protein